MSLIAPPGARQRGTARAALLVTAVLAVALIVGVAVVLTQRSDPDEPSVPASQPRGTPTASPAELGSSQDPVPAEPPERPNVVVVMADDMRADEVRFMPRMQRRFAEQGLTFRNSFSPYPLCCPARASFLTGQYTHNHEIFSQVEPWGFGAFDDRQTLATAVNAAGYNTMFLGKYLNGYGEQPSKVTGAGSFRYVPPGWNEWYGAPTRPENSGYDRGGTYNYFSTLFNVNGVIQDRYFGTYQTAVLGRMARRLVTTYARSPKPFFMYLAPVAPHFGSPRERDDPRARARDGKPVTVKTPARPGRVRGVFDARIGNAGGLPRDGGLSEADVSDKPRYLRAKSEPSASERAALLNLTRQRAESLYVLDLELDRLVRRLRSIGELDNTVLVFTSDNGYFLGEHRVRQGKIKPYEPSLRVPMMVLGQDVPSGQRFDPVTTISLTSTIADLTGATMPFPPDAASFRPSFRGDRGWAVPVLTEGRETSRFFRVPASRRAPGFDGPRTTIGVRTARWKYVRYNTGEVELYDLDADPNELFNLAGAPRYADVRDRLLRAWWRYKDCAGAECRRPLEPALRRSAEENRRQTLSQARGVSSRYGSSF